MYLIVGLGNPGQRYQHTRHNVGFMAVDYLIDRYNIAATGQKHQGLCYKGRINDYQALLFKPLTYMNRSGIAVSEIANFYKIPLNHIIILYDELALTLGKIRIKIGGGSAGHNGIKSLDSHLGKDYQRIRIGIDHPGHRDEVTNYVLGRFKPEEYDLMAHRLDDLSEAFPLLLAGDKERFISQLSR